MPQETQDGVGWEAGPEPCGGGDGLLQRWSLNHAFGDQPGDRLCRIKPADHGERIEPGRLFEHDPVNTKTGEAPARCFEGGDRCNQVAPSRFGSQSETIAEPRIGEGGDQAVVIEHVPRVGGPRLVAGRAPFHRACARGK
jgi:hypothetical protein